MMRALLSVLVATAACSSSAVSASSGPSQKEFADAKPSTLASATWNGEPIVIRNDSVDFVNGPTGVHVIVDSTATHITAVATFTARADDDAHARDAQESVDDARQAF